MMFVFAFARCSGLGQILRFYGWILVMFFF